MREGPNFLLVRSFRICPPCSCKGVSLICIYEIFEMSPPSCLCCQIDSFLYVLVHDLSPSNLAWTKFVNSIQLLNTQNWNTQLLCIQAVCWIWHYLHITWLHHQPAGWIVSTTIMCWEFQNLYQIMNRKTLAAPFSNLTVRVDMIIYELAPWSVTLV